MEEVIETIEESEEEHNSESLKLKPGPGGARPNSGRKKGVMTDHVKERIRVEKEMKSRIVKSVDKLLNSQMNLAQGVQMLYKIEKDKEGNKKKPELITSQCEIEAYLAGDYEGDGDYYFITTERPDNRALDSLLDRTFGKARQNIGLDGGEDNKPIPIMVIESKNNEPLLSNDSDDEDSVDEEEG